MNTDIRIQCGWYRHPKIIKLRRRLGAEGVLGLVTLWTWAGEQRANGKLNGMDAEDIVIAAGYPEDAQLFVDMLINLRLLDQDEDGALSIHNWEENNPYAANADERSALAKKAAQAKWNKNAQSMRAAPEPQCAPHPNRNAQSMRAASEPQCAPHPNRNAPYPFPFPSPFPSPDPSPDPAPFPFPFPSPTPSAPEAVAELATGTANDEGEKEKKGGDKAQVCKNGEKHTLAADWQPHPDTLAIIGQMNIPLSFADDCLPQFRLWHREQGTARAGFESLFVGWTKKAWAERPPDAPPGGRRKGQTLVEQLLEQHDKLFGPDDVDPFSFRPSGEESEHVQH